MRKHTINANKVARSLDSLLKSQGNTEKYIQGEEQVEKFRRQRAVPKRTQLVRYTFNPELAGPSVGESLMVCHRAVDGREQRSNTEARTIKAVYMSDRHGHCVKDSVGDVWHVRPSSVGGAKWESFMPGERQKVKV